MRVSLPEGYIDANVLTLTDMSGNESTLIVQRDMSGAYVYVEAIPDAGMLVISK